MDEERREKTRVGFKTEVIIDTGESKITSEASSNDISLKGVFINTDQMVDIGTQCDIEILLTGSSSNLSMKMQGKVIRQEHSTGIGIKFESIDLDSYLHLKNILMYNSGDVPGIEESEIEEDGFEEELDHKL